MPLLILVVFLLLVPLVAMLLAPVALVQRYRRGTARRPARAWVATLNLVTLAFSATLFLSTAGIVGLWVPRAFLYSLAGLTAGALLAFVGLRLTRWEPSADALYYTPNRWLVLTVTVVVAARMLYGIWRAWYAWQYRPDDTSWLVAAGIAGSMAAGGVVLGYYLFYWAGVRRRLARYRGAHVVSAGR